MTTDPDRDRRPTAWGSLLDPHDYSRTGKHDPNDCRYCLREDRTRLQKLVDDTHRYPLGFKLE